MVDVSVTKLHTPSETHMKYHIMILAILKVRQEMNRLQRERLMEKLEYEIFSEQCYEQAKEERENETSESEVDNEDN